MHGLECMELPRQHAGRAKQRERYVQVGHSYLNAATGSIQIARIAGTSIDVNAARNNREPCRVDRMGLTSNSKPLLSSKKRLLQSRYAQWRARWR